MNLVMRARWLKTRLQAMSFAEMASRVVDVGQHVLMLIFLRRIIQNYVAVQPAMTTSSLSMGPISFSMKGTYGEGCMLERACADRWLEHRARLFSLEDLALGEVIDWNRDYSTGVRGPMKYSGLIDHRNSIAVSDVKYVWELNRLQHLVLLGLALNRTGNSVYGDEIVRQTCSWISSNPFMIGLNWKSPLEAAIRLISWALVSCLVGGRLPAVFHDKLRIAVYQHQYFIRKFYSKHSSANNHLIGEMTGLYVAAVIWPLYRESKSWCSMARETLIQETMRQVEPDGVGRELATEYQLFILEFLLMAGALGQVTGEPFPQEFWQRLQGMIDFLSAISDRNGNFPMFGDGDSGQVIALPQTMQARGRSLVRFGRLDREPVSNAVDTDTRTRLLFWGQRSESLPFTSEPARQQGLRVFPQGGYYVLAAGQGQDDAMMVVFDAGQLGLPPLYAHGHADALSFWLSYGGQEFFIDPGTFSYYGHDLWRDYFRGTAAHNTIRIDGQDQSVASGRFQWSHVARTEVHHTQDTDQWVELEGFHEGYRRLTDPVIHRRCLRLFKQSKNILITDRLICVDSHDVEIFFHFHERCHVTQIGINVFTAEIDNMRLRISLDRQLTSELLRGSEKPMLGWVSRNYGIKVPSSSIVGRARLTGSKQFLTEIAPA